jgi:hypothetical protein|nr:MAG TPA: hypothetical protein [Caudoviricetes sp.]
MTYKEFKERVEELGLSCRFYDYGVNVYSIDDFAIATIYDTKRYFGVINFNSSLDSIKKVALLWLCYDLMRTPLENRGELQ